MPRLKLTAKSVAKIKAPDPSGKQQLHWDTQMRGFGVLVSGKTNARTYICQKDINGKSRRVTVGPVDDNVMTLSQAREAAGPTLAMMFSGVDPKLKRKAEKDAAYSLQNALDDYLNLSKDLRPKTANGYRFLVERHFPDWLEQPLKDISRTMVEERHQDIAKKIWANGRSPTETGQASANASVRILRVLWNFANDGRDIQGLPSKNPARLHKNVWFASKERTGHVAEDELAMFYDAVLTLENHIQRHCVLLILFTGYRSAEARGLRWDEIDFNHGTITIPGDRTKARRDHCIPMSSFVRDILVARRVPGVAGPHVFPANSRSGHIEEIKYPMGLVSKGFGRHITAHDLRRTFITIAEQISMSVYALKAIANHAGDGDITGKYIQFGPERLREPVQAITDRLMELCNMSDEHGENIAKFV